MITSSIRSWLEHVLQVLQGAQRTQAVSGQWVGREETDDLDRRVRRIPERVGDVADVPAAAHEHRAALVAGRSQQDRRDPLIRRARRGDVEDGERQRAPEEVVAGEVFAADDRVDERHERDLEQRPDDPREPGAQGALGVQP